MESHEMKYTNHGHAHIGLHKRWFDYQAYTKHGRTNQKETQKMETGSQNTHTHPSPQGIHKQWKHTGITNQGIYMGGHKPRSKNKNNKPSMCPITHKPWPQRQVTQNIDTHRNALIRLGDLHCDLMDLQQAGSWPKSSPAAPEGALPG